MITRFAPTPSGYLHVGNAVNAQLVSWLAASAAGTVALRVDDMDAPRFRPEYLSDIFAVMRWLGIEWSLGPADEDDFDRHSLTSRTAHYRTELEAARQRGLVVYACRCSRRELSGPATGGCPGGCVEGSHAFVIGETALRAHIPPGTSVAVDGTDIPLDTSMGDVVIWRREDLPAYHLACIVEDRDLGVTHVVRGDDLRASTAVQLFLAPYFAATELTKATFIHHPLVNGPDGTKLSKSTLSSGPLARTPEMRAEIRRLALQTALTAGIRPPG